MTRTRHATVYVRCRPAELWAALTEGQVSRRYYYNAIADSTFVQGASIRYLIEGEDAGESQVVIEGEIVEIDPQRSLVHSFRFCDLDDPPSTIRWTISEHEVPGVLRVDVEHSGLPNEGETWARVDPGWPLILSGLKTWLETGHTLLSPNPWAPHSDPDDDTGE